MKTIYRAFSLLLCMALLLLPLCSCRDEEETLPASRDLVWAVGVPMPRAAEFFEALPDGWTAEYDREYVFSNTGVHEVGLTLTTEKGKKLSTSARFTLTVDVVPPVLEGVTDRTVYIGDGVSYRSGVTLRDNCGGTLRLEVDTSAVDLSTEGAYEVVYRAWDAIGNLTERTVRLYVYREVVTEQMLFDALDAVIAAQIPTAGTTEQQIRAVYQYVFYHVSYNGHSDKSDWRRAAYDGLRTGEGDCYTYFALSKAFFERLGIQNMDIQRTEGLVPERHYWNYVNVGSEEASRWYHFDACRINGASHSGCLLTNRQIDSYSQSRAYEDGTVNYFYAYDRAAYPSCAEDILTPTPSLEPYD